MAIVALKKLTLFGSSADRDQMLEVLQTLGCAHLIALQEPGYSDDQVSSARFEKTLKALKYLSQYPGRNQYLDAAGELDLDDLVDRILAIQLQERQLRDQRTLMVERIKAIEPWGNIEFPENSSLSGFRLWFYRVPAKAVAAMNRVDSVWQCVHRDDRYHYIVVIDRNEPAPSSMPVPRTPMGAQSLSRLKQELNQLDRSLASLHREREKLGQGSGQIAAGLAKLQDEFQLKVAESFSVELDGIFLIQAWVPASALIGIKQFVDRHTWAMCCSDPNEKENPPTLLSNPEALAGGEELIRFYHPPGYFGWDPSILLFFSFAVFFSMILSDAGYAALFGLLLAVFWRKLGQTKTRLRLRRLAAVAIASASGWGIAAGSYFGVSPSAGNVLAQLVIIDVNDVDSMMALSIAVGTAHIALANIIVFWQRFGRMQALASLGWLCVLIGGFLQWHATYQQGVFPSQLIAALLGSGILLILFFSGKRSIKSPVDVLRQLWDGVVRLMKLSQLFGDVLSYLRLFALGLSSASMALVFNQLAESVASSLPGVGIVLAVLVLLLGHLLNLLLCLMSGVVHGLRLNFIEFFRWGITEEGHPFKPFAKRS